MKEHRSLPRPKNIEINQLTGTSISLTLRTKAFLDESDDLVSLDTPHHSFPMQEKFLTSFPSSLTDTWFVSQTISQIPQI